MTAGTRAGDQTRRFPGHALWRRLSQSSRQVSATFWFVPALCILGAFILSQLMVALDRLVTINPYIPILGWVADVGADGARSMLSTIGTAMLGVAATAFSITISVIATASSNYGPRLVRNFMADRGNQIVLGMLSATFIYALLILRTIRAASEHRDAYVPQLSVTLAILFALIDVGMLVWFIHHIADSIQVNTIAQGVRRRWLASVERWFPASQPENYDYSESHPFPRGSADLELGPTISRSLDAEADPQHHYSDTSIEAHLVTLEQVGYLVEIDIETIAEVAADLDLRVVLLKRVGDHVVTGEPVMQVWSPAEDDAGEERAGAEKAADAEASAEKTAEDEKDGASSSAEEKESAAEEATARLRRQFVVDDSRTTYQDLRFAQEQLIELAVRALSPGTNDPYTAINAINELGAGISIAVSRPRLGDVVLCDDEPRVWYRPISQAEMLRMPFDHIRPYAADSMIVTAALVELGRRAQAATVDPELAELAGELIDQLVAQMEEGSASEADVARIRNYVSSTKRTLPFVDDADED